MTNFRFPYRIAGLREQLTQGETPVDALFVSDLENARYLSGFTGSNAALIVTPDVALFFTDGRYRLQSEQEVTGFERIIMPQGAKFEEEIGNRLKEMPLTRLGIEGGNLTFAAYQNLKKHTPESLELIVRDDIVSHLRQVKDENEIAATRKAVAVVDACFERIQRVFRLGMTENELAWEIEVFLRKEQGATRLAFDSIVGSGPNSALIHGRPTDRVIGSSGEPEFLLCDYGCEVDGYTADITRTFVVGGEPTARQQELYDAVLRAQLAAIEAIQPGKLGKDVDKVARDVLTEAGFGEAFGHGLGHGLGRVVHDHKMFNTTSEIPLRVGMIVTVEPGAYLDGFGGVRIEDDVLVTAQGCEILTQSHKELTVLK